LPLKPLLNLITDRLALRHSPDWPDYAPQLELIREAAAAGIDFVQVREPDLSAKRLEEFVHAVLEVTRPYRARVLVNDRIDVALVAGAAGVHLKASSIPIREARRISFDGFVIGVSTHSLAEARSADDGGADFIVAGPVFETPSKKSYGAPLGLDRFQEICVGAALPVLAIGGITLDNYQMALDRGGAGIAAIRLFQQDAAATVRRLAGTSARDEPS
jgi:thiamine-phosphate pyrophosphorylase